MTRPSLDRNVNGKTKYFTETKEPIDDDTFGEERMSSIIQNCYLLRYWRYYTWVSLHTDRDLHYHCCLERC
jgi:hypothetical protein